ncbi:DUF6789 family protein [Bdellovibrio sp. HCB185ZH]|uniref:DUF6789 family protein n=1 Tax=Bdellovibrio sp. HCB185ZH TaxID=3394235 RepID=UPI0039A6158E
MNVLFRGLWASTMATSTMSYSLFEAFKRFTLRDRIKPLPQAQVAATALEKLHIPKLGSEAQQEAAMISHYGYGAVFGIAYALLASKIPGSNPVIKGSLFGLGVWAASYFGIIPAFNLEPKNRKQTTQRKSLIIGSHIIWGIGMAIAENSLRKRGTRMLDARHRT